MKKYDIFDYLQALPDIPDEKCGIEYESKCPCGGTLRAIRSKQYGHMHASCDKCGFVLHE